MCVGYYNCCPERTGPCAIITIDVWLSLRKYTYEALWSNVTFLVMSDCGTSG